MRTEPEQQESIMQLETYGFAKRHGVLLVELNVEGAKMIYRSDASPEAIEELRRHLRIPCHLEKSKQRDFQ